jgi:hypothetical protein
MNQRFKNIISLIHGDKLGARKLGFQFLTVFGTYLIDFLFKKVIGNNF